MGDVTRILSDIEDGDSGAVEQLLPLIYDELRRLAAQKMSGESPDHTLQATALVHEAYVRLVGLNGVQHWNSRGHFFAAAAEAMRRILVENARRKQRIRHGGDRDRIDLDAIDPASLKADEKLLGLNEGLASLEIEQQVAAEVVKLRYFAGLTTEQCAELLGISVRTVQRHWKFARAYLQQTIYSD